MRRRNDTSCSLLLGWWYFFVLSQQQQLVADAFTTSHHLRTTLPSRIQQNAVGEQFSIPLELPPSSSNQAAQITFSSVLTVPSHMILVRYKVPFEIALTPAQGFVVCTQTGPGGEREGDLLRYFSHFAVGLPRGESIAHTINNNITWKCSMYNVMKAQTWNQVMEALTSNTEARTDEVVFVFERPLEMTALLVEAF